MKHKKVLVVYYSQTGQLTSVVKSIGEAVESESIQVTYEALCPEPEYPFPWPLLKFLDVFPESVYLDPPVLQPIKADVEESFDLLIVAYTVWFLSPSLPITAFLKSSEGKRLLAGKPVVTVIACRDMWLMAQEKVKGMLAYAGAHLLDNIALVDAGPSLATFITTPRWMLTGKKGRTGGLLPKAGVAENEIKNAARFGRAIKHALQGDEEKRGQPLLKGLKAVDVDSNLIASEKVGQRSFAIWGKILRSFGPAGDPKRKPILVVYVIFLIVLIVTVVPLNMLIKRLLRPLTKNKLQQQKYYFEQPSGSETFRMQEFMHDE
ncbi:dialkylrecorsinol condensing enzyme [Kaarinaea lacus]